jgi:hypothetical protein
MGKFSPSCFMRQLEEVDSSENYLFHFIHDWSMLTTKYTNVEAWGNKTDNLTF